MCSARLKQSSWREEGKTTEACGKGQRNAVEATLLAVKLPDNPEARVIMSINVDKKKKPKRKKNIFSLHFLSFAHFVLLAAAGGMESKDFSGALAGSFWKREREIKTFLFLSHNNSR